MLPRMAARAGIGEAIGMDEGVNAGRDAGRPGGGGRAKRPRDGTGGRGGATASWLATARRPEIVRRSLRVAAVVGTILVAINYLDRLVAGGLSSFDGLKMATTYLVPYCVSTYAAVETVRRGR
ncbi:MAG: nitrate/nitrite transporter NrtS [Myxococcota bacterium]